MANNNLSVLVANNNLTILVATNNRTILVANNNLGVGVRLKYLHVSGRDGVSTDKHLEARGGVRARAMG